MNKTRVSKLQKYVSHVRAWHPNPPEHECPSRTYNELADAVEYLLKDYEPDVDCCELAEEVVERLRVEGYLADVDLDGSGILVHTKEHKPELCVGVLPGSSGDEWKFDIHNSDDEQGEIPLFEGDATAECADAQELYLFVIEALKRAPGAYAAGLQQWVDAGRPDY